MLKLTINLLPKYSLNLVIKKRPKNLDIKPIFPSLGDVLRYRAGNKFSRYFRHIFESKRFKKIFGANLALLITVTTFIPNQNAYTFEPEEVHIQTPLVLTTKQGVRYPLKNIEITQKFKIFHPGLDLDGKTGDPVYPITAGIVEYAGYSRFGYGNNILINHGNNVISLYAHLSKIEVREGQEVDSLIEIGKVGSTGYAHGDHLHLEIKENGKPINPLTILSKS